MGKGERPLHARRRPLWLAASLGVTVAVVAAVASTGGAATGAGKASSVSTLAAPAGDDWSAANGDLAGSRYSGLTQINTSNVAKLKVAWSRAVDTPEMLGASGAFSGIESTPLVANGVMYVPTPIGVAALDAVTGKAKWTFSGTAPLAKPCFGTFCLGSSANAARDISLGEGMVFVGQQDGSIIAVNQKTGAEVWQAQVASVGSTAGTVKETNPWTMYADGVVLASINGGDSPLQGHIDGYDAKTGRLLWRWFTTPDPTSLPFILSWTNPAEAATGGASPWVMPVVDTALGRVYFETGNPHANLSPGKNLWSSSIVSLDLKTGALKWYFQAIHHDQWDYDCSTPPVLFNEAVNGKTVPAIAAMCKTGYVFVFDRRNGRPLVPVHEIAVPNPGNVPLGTTWPTQPETTGGSASVVVHCASADLIASETAGTPAPRGTSYVPACPYAVPQPGQTPVWGTSPSGGPDFGPPSIDPQNGYLYVCSNGSLENSGHLFPVSGVSGYISALDVASNRLAWRVTWTADKQGMCFGGGMLSTAGGLVFASSSGQPAVLATAPFVQPFGGTFYALDAKSGKELYSYQNSSEIMAPPITYAVKGRQYIAVDMTSSVNQGSFYSGEALGDKLTVFTLGTKVSKSKTSTTTTTGPGGKANKPPATETLIGDPSNGANLFASSACGSCHALAAAGSKGTAGPSLDQLAPGQQPIVSQVTNGGFNMPAYGSKLTAQQIRDLAAFIYQSTHS